MSVLTYLMCFRYGFTYLGRHAYAAETLFGDAYFRGCRRVCRMYVRCSPRVALMQAVASFEATVCKIGAVACAAVPTVWWWQFREPADLSASLIISSLVLAYILASAVLDVYSCAIETLCVCFVVDVESGADGSVEKPYAMSKNMLKFMAREERYVQRKTEKHYTKLINKCRNAEVLMQKAMSYHLDANMQHGHDEELEREH